MSSVLAEIQAQYDARAQAALTAANPQPVSKPRKKGTRTYTGAALARRQAWGRERAQFGKWLATTLPTEKAS